MAEMLFSIKFDINGILDVSLYLDYEISIKITSPFIIKKRKDVILIPNTKTKIHKNKNLKFKRSKK